MTTTLPVEKIVSKIYLIRNLKVMLDKEVILPKDHGFSLNRDFPCTTTPFIRDLRYTTTG